jgi:thiamine kinase-like enzyme
LLINRDVEEVASRVTASLGVGAGVVAALRDEGALVLEYVAGVPIAPERMVTPPVLRRIARALRTLHAGPPFPGVVDPFRVTELRYQAALSTGGVDSDQMRDYEWAHPIAERIESTVDFSSTSPCHGDLLAGNFLDDGNIRILDWECAGMSDPRFDLANFSVNQQLALQDDRNLVHYYYGAPDEHAVAAIRLLRFMSAFRETMWGLVQQNISQLDFDYRAYSEEYFRRMRDMTRDPRFGEWFDILSAADGGGRADG